MIPKKGETRPVVIQDAQQGSPQSQAKLLEENRPLVYNILSQWDISPRTIGKDAYQDFIGEIELHILTVTLPGYDPTKARWSTFLYKSINNFITDIVMKGGRSQTRQLYPQEESLDVAPSGAEGETRSLYDVTPDISTTGINPQMELILESVKQQLSPVDQMILEYRVLGYKPKDIAEYFQETGTMTPRGGMYDAHMVTWRWNNVIKPMLEEIFPPQTRTPYQFQKEQYVGDQPSPYEKPAPAYRVDPETGERTLIPTQGEQTTAGMLSLRKKASYVLDVLDYIRIRLLHDD